MGTSKITAWGWDDRVDRIEVRCEHAGLRPGQLPLRLFYNLTSRLARLSGSNSTRISCAKRVHWARRKQRYALSWPFTQTVLRQVPRLIIAVGLFVAWLGEPHLIAVGLLTPGDGLPQKPAGLHHLKRHQAVEPSLWYAVSETSALSSL